MNTYNSPDTAIFVAQAQTIRNQFIAQTLRSIFTFPAFAKLTTFWREEHKIRIAIRELRMSSDRELTDLGIARADIEDVIRLRGEFFAQPEVRSLRLKTDAPKTTKKSSANRSNKFKIAA